MSGEDEDLGAYADASATALGLALTPESRAAVIVNLAVLRRMAETVAEVPLQPGDDPLPLFRP